MSTTRVFPAASGGRRRRKRWDGSLQPAAGGTTGTLGAASAVGSVAFSATNTPPATTGTLGAASAAGSASLAATNTPPASTGTLGAPSAAGSVSFAGTNTPPATTGTIGAASASGSVAFAGLNTPPATTGSLAAGSVAGSVAFAGFAVVGSVGTLAPASAPGSVAFAALNTPPATTGTLGASAAAGSVALAGLAVVGNAGTLGASAASGSVSFSGTNTPPAATGTVGSASATGSVSFAGLNTPPVTTGTLGASAAPGSVVFAALAVAPAVTGTLGASSAPARAAFAGAPPVTATGNGPWPHAVWANAVWANAVWAGALPTTVGGVPILQLIQSAGGGLLMPARNQPLTVTYTAWNTATQQGQPGDAANHTLKVSVDGVEQAVTGVRAEVDPVNGPGEYSVTLTNANTNGDALKFFGKSSTPGVVVIPFPIFTDGGGVNVSKWGGVPTTQLPDYGQFLSLGMVLAGATTGAVVVDFAPSAPTNLASYAGNACEFALFDGTVVGGTITDAAPVTGHPTQLTLTFGIPLSAAPSTGDAAVIKAVP